MQQLEINRVFDPISGSNRCPLAAGEVNFRCRCERSTVQERRRVAAAQIAAVHARTAVELGGFYIKHAIDTSRAHELHSAISPLAK